MTKGEISAHITSLLVYQAMVKDAVAVDASPYDVHRYMRWFNESARVLNKTGYGNITLYKSNGVEL